MGIPRCIIIYTILFGIIRSVQAPKVVIGQSPMATGTSDAELNNLLDQIEQEIGMDEELTQDLLDILNDEERLKEEEVNFLWENKP